jgi:malate dehydrogenase (oxaloacetate-decarboxylating)
MFNDDMQGTGVVTLAAMLAAIHATKVPLDKQRVIIFGAGTAGVGIADQLFNAMVRQGIPEEEARRKFWLVDRAGVILADQQDAAFFQKPYARPLSEIPTWPENQRDLLSVVKAVKPTIMVGCSTVRNAFNENIVRAMAQQVAQPIIFPLSNPNENCEANPENLLQWSEGRAIIATGSPFDPIQYNDKTYHIAQCNNALSFPGIGIGVIAVRATQLTDNMLWAASQAISLHSPMQQNALGSLLPYVTEIPTLAQKVAVSVAKQAIEDGVARNIPKGTVEDFIREQIWRPYYRPIRLMKKT